MHRSGRSKGARCLGKACALPSKACSHDVSEVPEGASKRAKDSSWSSDILDAATTAEAGVTGELYLKISGDCDGRTLAIPEAKANDHTSSTTKALLRLARRLEKHFMEKN